MTDPYKILGVDSSASDDEIKKAYKRLAKQHHPDVGGSEDKFQQINEAYDRIKNGNVYEENHNFDFNQRDQFRYRTSPFDFEDLFAQHFHNKTARRPVQHNTEIIYHVDLEDIVAGAEKNITYSLQNGLRKEVTIRIPKGITAGSKVRYHGFGSTADSDLLVTFELKKHHTYRVEEHNLIYPLHIKLKEAMFGADKIIQTIDDRQLRLHIKAGTQHKTRLRVPESGLPRKGMPNGDLFIEINVTIPKLSENDLYKTLNDIDV